MKHKVAIINSFCSWAGMSTNNSKCKYTGWSPSSARKRDRATATKDKLNNLLDSEASKLKLCEAQNEPQVQAIHPDQAYTYLGVETAFNGSRKLAADAIYQKFLVKLQAVSDAPLSGAHAQLAIEETVVGSIRYYAGLGIISVKLATKMSRAIAACLILKYGLKKEGAAHDIVYLARSEGGLGMTPVEKVVAQETLAVTRLTLDESAPRLCELYRKLYAFYGRRQGVSKDYPSALPLASYGIMEHLLTHTQSRCNIVRSLKVRMIGSTGTLQYKGRTLMEVMRARQWIQETPYTIKKGKQLGATRIRRTDLSASHISALWANDIFLFSDLLKGPKHRLSTGDSSEWRSPRRLTAAAKRSYTLIRALVRGRKGRTYPRAGIEILKRLEDNFWQPIPAELKVALYGPVGVEAVQNEAPNRQELGPFTAKRIRTNNGTWAVPTRENLIVPTAPGSISAPSTASAEENGSVSSLSFEDLYGEEGQHTDSGVFNSEGVVDLEWAEEEVTGIQRSASPGGSDMEWEDAIIRENVTWPHQHQPSDNTTMPPQQQPTPLIEEEEWFEMGDTVPASASPQQQPPPPIEEEDWFEMGETFPAPAGQAARVWEPLDLEPYSRFRYGGSDAPPLPYWEKQVGRQCIRHATNMFLGRAAIQQEWAVRECLPRHGGTFSVFHSGDALSWIQGAGITMQERSWDARDMVTEDLVQLITHAVQTYGKIICFGDANWPGGPYGHAVVLTRFNIDTLSHSDNRVFLHDSDSPNTKSTPILVGSEDFPWHRLPVIGSCLYPAETRDATLDRWARHGRRIQVNAGASRKPRKTPKTTFPKLKAATRSSNFTKSQIKWTADAILDHRNTQEGTEFLTSWEPSTLTEKSLAKHRIKHMVEATSRLPRCLRGQATYKVTWAPTWEPTNAFTNSKVITDYWEAKRAQGQATLLKMPLGTHVTKDQMDSTQDFARRITQYPTPTYEVDTLRCNPHLDVNHEQPHVALAASSASNASQTQREYRLYEQGGRCRGTIKEDRFVQLMGDFLSANPGATDSDARRALTALLTRYSPDRRSGRALAKREYKDEWATPTQLLAEISELCKIQHELFSHPLNHNSAIPNYWTPSKDDAVFGAGHDAFSWNWHSICWMNPEYEKAACYKAIEYALKAATTAPDRVPTAVVALLPHFTDYEYMRLLKSHHTNLIWTIDRKSNFNFTPPADWAQIEEKAGGADFDMGLYVIGNRAGMEQIQSLCTVKRPWDALHKVMERAASRHNWNQAKVSALSSDTLNVAQYHTRIKGYRKNGNAAPMRVPVNRAMALSQIVDWSWYQRLPSELKYTPEESVYTDGSVSKKKKGGAGVFFPGSGVARCVSIIGDTNSTLAEMRALQDAVDTITTLPDSRSRVWYIFTDSLACLNALARYKRSPHSSVHSPLFQSIMQLASTADAAGIRISFHKVKAHTDIPGNEAADEAARQGRLYAAGEEAQDAEEMDERELPEGDFAELFVDKKFDSIEAIQDFEGDVAMYEIEQGDDHLPIYRVKDFKKLLKRRRYWFQTQTPSHLRGCTNKRQFPRPKPSMASADDFCTPHEARFSPISPEVWKHGGRKAHARWLKLLHKLTVTEYRASKFWLKENRKSYPCPLCGGTFDHWTHILLVCEHKVIKDMRIKRHNDGLRLILRAIRKGVLGGWAIAADLPEWTVDTQKLCRDTYEPPSFVKVPMPVLPEPEDEPLEQVETLSQMSEAPSSDSGDTDRSALDTWLPAGSEDLEVDSELIDQADWDTETDNDDRQSEATDTSDDDPTEEVLEQATPAEYEEAMEDLVSANTHQSILHSMFGYTGRQKADGVLMTGLRHWADAHHAHECRSTGVVHLIEFTFFSESDDDENKQQRLSEVLERKQSQYTDIIAALKRHRWKVVLHILPMGARGLMPHYTEYELRDLGVKGDDLIQLRINLGKLAKRSGCSLVANRHRLEMEPEYRAKSALFRYIQMKRRQSKQYRKKNQSSRNANAPT
jgi:ribonuclease HI